MIEVSAVWQAAAVGPGAAGTPPPSVCSLCFSSSAPRMAGASGKSSAHPSTHTCITDGPINGNLYILVNKEDLSCFFWEGGQCMAHFIAIFYYLKKAKNLEGMKLSFAVGRRFFLGRLNLISKGTNRRSS